VGDLLNHVLRHHRHSQYLGLVLPWRPLYDMLMGIYDNPVPGLRGEAFAREAHSVRFKQSGDDASAVSTKGPGMCKECTALHPTCPSIQGGHEQTHVLHIVCPCAPPPGTFLDHLQQSTLFTLVTRCRRWFGPGAAAEIWALLRPALVSGDPFAAPTHCALGWLVLFFPTKQLPHTPPEQAQVRGFGGGGGE
jgi:hypothetical protein